MALTTTEEQQIRELLRHAAASQNGKTASQLPQASTILSVGPYIAKGYNSDVLTTVPRNVVIADLLDSEPLAGARNSQVAGSTNHLMTRNATRNEITSMTSGPIQAAKTAADKAQGKADVNETNVNSMRSEFSFRLSNIETWRDNVITPAMRTRLRSAGPGYSSDPVFMVGAMNSPGSTYAQRKHLFPYPLKPNPLVFFSVWGDVNFPRFELVDEGGKITGFVTQHSPTGGLWMAIGEKA
jgi:hypothetical protein